MDSLGRRANRGHELLGGHPPIYEPRAGRAHLEQTDRDLTDATHTASRQRQVSSRRIWSVPEPAIRGTLTGRSDVRSGAPGGDAARGVRKISGAESVGPGAVGIARRRAPRCSAAAGSPADYDEPPSEDVTQERRVIIAPVISWRELRHRCQFFAGGHGVDVDDPDLKYLYSARRGRCCRREH
jgi:hypothetical protein